MVKNSEPNISLDRVLTTQRFDVLNSSISDSRPRFPLPSTSIASIVPQKTPSPFLQDLVQQLCTASAAYAEIAAGLEATAHFAEIVNANANDPRFWKDGATAAKHITPIMHRLLSLPKLVEWNTTANEPSEASLLS